MTLRLILIRHAKSSWNDPFSDDHARVLNARGRASATTIGTWMAKHGYVPQIVLCSDAARTQETAKLILPALTPPPRLRLSAMLYHAAPDTVFDMVKQETAPVVAVIGHNPGIGMLANALVETPPAHRRFGDYPTGATTVIDFATDTWLNIKRRSGQCKAFVVPRDLIGATGHEMD